MSAIAQSLDSASDRHIINRSLKRRALLPSAEPVREAVSVVMKTTLFILRPTAPSTRSFPGTVPTTIVSTAVAVDAIRQKFPECPCDDEELVGLMLHAMARKKIAVSFDHRVEPVMRPKAPSIISLRKDLHYVDHHKSIVILEDEALIALEGEDSLRDAGFKTAGIFSSCAEALNWFEGNSPDAVVMDIDLADGDCVRIARLLQTRDIPFVVHSASFANSGFHDPIFLYGRWVAKPASPSELRDAVRASLSVADDDISRSAKAQ